MMRSQKQEIRQRIERQRQQEQLAAARRADAEHLARLKREEARRKRYRLIGSCTYDWQSWGKSPSGVRSVKAAGCSGVTEVAVDCKNTKVSMLKWSKWRPWKIPNKEFEDLVVESCANILGATKPSYVEPTLPVSNQSAVLKTNSTSLPKKPICTGPAILCEMP